MTYRTTPTALLFAARAAVIFSAAALAAIPAGCPALEEMAQNAAPADGPVAGEFAALDEATATLRGTPVVVRLTAAVGEGQSATFGVESDPSGGTLSEIRSVDAGSAEVTYTPNPDFAGTDQFTFVAQVGEDESNVGTAQVAVYPRVFFNVSTAEGSRSLPVEAAAVCDDGSDLPQGTYTWTFEDSTETGPVETHGRVNRTFSTGGVHPIALTVTLAGLAAPVTCPFVSEAGESPQAEIKVAPAIAGFVNDVTGKPLGGVEFQAEGVAQLATTDEAGRFRIEVPYGWAGALVPLLGDGFDPPARTYESVTADLVDQNYANSKLEALVLPGKVNDATGAPLAGVSVVATGLAPTPPTGEDGSFKVLAYTGWSGTIQATSPEYDFQPHAVEYTPARKQPMVVFTATPMDPNMNRPPTAYSRSFTTDEDTAKSAVLSATDPDGDALTYVILTLPSRGALKDTGTNQVITAAQLPYSLAFRGRGVTYVPNTNYGGGDGFSFRVNDGLANSNTATMTITVQPVNDRPTANAQQVTTAANTPKVITLTGSDVETAVLTYGIASQPQHGTLAGTGAAYTYTPSAGYQGPDSFTFTASDGQLTSAPATVNITVGTSGWTPPIGIPAPPFGIAQTHTMYSGQQWNYGSGLEPYRNAGNGPYTHYIDSTHGSATDTNNTFGSPSRPRRTIPTNLPAGSVVELHGGPYTYQVGSYLPLSGNGTSQQPIFIRGYSATQRVRIGAPLSVAGQYIIIENVDINGWSSSNYPAITIYNGVSNIALRKSEVQNGPEATTSAVAIGGNAHHIVVYGNKIHDNGDWRTTYDQDHHGIGVGDAYEIWVVDNEMYHNSGDGIQINGSSLASTHHIYVGRNTAWENKQAGTHTKKAADVIFSQNTVHSHSPSDSSPGAGMSFQYGPERVWLLYNHIYNCTFGINGASDVGRDDGLNAYVIGNVIHDIHAPAGTFNPNSGWSSGYGIHVRGCRYRYIVNNTIYNSDGGISGTYGGEFHIINNVVANLTQSGGRHIFIDASFSSAASTVRNNVFHGTVRISWGSSTPVYTLQAFQTATGKGQGCVNADPLFVNAATADLHLQPVSPAVNAGMLADVYATFQGRYGVNIARDCDGVTRPSGAAWDMGAFER